MNRVKPVFGAVFMLLCTVISAQLALESGLRSAKLMPAITVQTDQNANNNPPMNLERNKRSEEFYRTIVDRPVFEISRRPIVVKQPEPEIEEVPEIIEVEPVKEAPLKIDRLPEVHLMGVLLTGSTPSAFLSIDGNRAEWLRQGDSLNDWSLAKIAADFVEFTNNKNVVRVDLYNKRAE